jgi:hypothetical protein
LKWTSSNARRRATFEHEASGFSSPSGFMSRYSKMRSKTASALTICTCTPASAEAGRIEPAEVADERDDRSDRDAAVDREPAAGRATRLRGR